MTTVVNIKKTKHYDFYIGRGGPFGNPFDHNKLGITRAESIALYRDYFYKKLNDQAFYDRVQGLKDKVLGCFCKPDDCHGDVIAEYLNNETKRSPNSDKQRGTVQTFMQFGERPE